MYSMIACTQDKHTHINTLCIPTSHPTKVAVLDYIILMFTKVINTMKKYSIMTIKVCNSCIDISSSQMSTVF